SRPIENHADIFVTSFPYIAEECCGALLIERHRLFAQPIECIPQWSTPFLIPSITATGIAATVLTPAPHAMRAAPGTVLDNLCLVLRRMLLEVLSVIRETGYAFLLDVLQCISERHVSVSMVMSVALAVGGDVHELRPVAGVGKASCQTIRELLAAVEELLEGDSLRKGSVVEENGDAAAIAQAH